MRFLLFLRWSFLLLLAWSDDCEWKMPLEYDDTDRYSYRSECTQSIKWKARSAEEAHATCLQYFPTTFVKGEIDEQRPDRIKCTVKRQYLCGKDASVVSMFDKCYKFFPAEITMKEYLEKAASDDRLCGPNGALPIFYTMTQAKHIAKEAHRKGIFKMWVNVDKDGKTIEQSGMHAPGFLLYKDQWKLHKKHYWDGEELKITPKNDKQEPIFPVDAKYLFFRTKTDYFNNLYQGSFEMATDVAKASYVCEYEANPTREMEDYCNRMRDLGLNAIYDTTRSQLKRCLYTTLTQYSMEGTKEAIENFPGCREKPSKELSSGLDYGTAEKSVYNELTKDGTYRIAGIKVDNNVADSLSKAYAREARAHCSNQPYSVFQRQAFEFYDHFSEKRHRGYWTAPWESGYPKNECSDFPNIPAMHSNTLVIRRGNVVDVPVPARFKAICSIESNVDCALGRNPGGPFEKICSDDETCEDEGLFSEKTGFFASCRCTGFYEERNGVCEYKGGDGECGRYDLRNIDKHDIPVYVNDGAWQEIFNYKGMIYYASVKKGCRMSFWSRPHGHREGESTVLLLENVGFGDYWLPHYETDNLTKWNDGLTTTAVECKCP